MKELGGFLSPTVSYKFERFEHALALNTARNAIEYVLRLECPSAVWIPKWCCNAVVMPSEKLNIPINWYSVTQDFLPLDASPVTNELIIIINYYGLLKEKDIIAFKKKYTGVKIILDNSQAFYAQPLSDEYTIYSCRKFFAVADGAFLVTNKYLPENLEQDKSYDRIPFLFKRLELGANQAYADFLDNEIKVSQLPICTMSLSTEFLLSMFDWDMLCKRRIENYEMLHTTLSHLNSLRQTADIYGPLCYPLYIPGRGKKVKEELIARKIYVPTYWNDAIERVGDMEKSFIEDVVPLPVDQRYSMNDMRDLSNILLKLIC